VTHLTLRRGFAAVTVVLLAMTAGCGDADTEVSPATASPDSVSSTPVPTRSKQTSATPSAGPSDGAHAASSTAGAMGVDSVRWPADMASARRLVGTLPPQLDGLRLRGPRGQGRYLDVTYRAGTRSADLFVMGVGGPVKDPQSAVAVMFGMTLACAPKSYHGTIPKGYGGVPDIGPPADPGRTGWFTYSVRGAEGDPGFSGEALGWTSADSGWLITGSDRHTVALLAEQLVTAAQHAN
jgi:hypothetical protein